MNYTRTQWNQELVEYNHKRIDIRRRRCNPRLMFSVMLCGAADTRHVSAAFEETIRSFGGEALWYQSGRIHYLNGPDASWARNSRRTVSSADLCVFVIIEHYGAITWSTEIDEALTEGVPFIILCLHTTYNEYTILRQNGLNETIADDGKKNLVSVLMEIEFERQLTVVPFEMTNFSSTLEQQLAMLFRQSLQYLTEQNKRVALQRVLRTPEKLTRRELDSAEQLAIDEFEERGKRVMAVKAIAERGAAASTTVEALVASSERDVQRAAFALLPMLTTRDLVDQGFLEDCVSIANKSDDVGITRRLIPAVFKIDLVTAINACANLDLTEIGSRRRLAAELEEARTAFSDPSTRRAAVDLLRKCTEKSTQESGWLARARKLLKQYEDENGEE